MMAAIAGNTTTTDITINPPECMYHENSFWWVVDCNCNCNWSMCCLQCYSLSWAHANSHVHRLLCGSQVSCMSARMFPVCVEKWLYISNIDMYSYVFLCMSVYNIRFQMCMYTCFHTANSIQLLILQIIEQVRREGKERAMWCSWNSTCSTATPWKVSASGWWGCIFVANWGLGRDSVIFQELVRSVRWQSEVVAYHGLMKWLCPCTACQMQVKSSEHLGFRCNSALYSCSTICKYTKLCESFVRLAWYWNAWACHCRHTNKDLIHKRLEVLSGVLELACP